MENLPINLYGESIFTSFRSWESNIPGLNLHFERLAKSLNHYFFNNLEDLDKIKSIISKKIKLDNEKEHHRNHFFSLFSRPVSAVNNYLI